MSSRSSRSVHRPTGLISESSSFASSVESEGDDEMTEMVELGEKMNEEFAKLGHTKKQVQLRWFLACFCGSPSLLQRVVVLRKYHLFLGAASLIILFVVTPLRRYIQESRPPSKFPLPSVALKHMLPQIPLHHNPNKSKQAPDSDQRKTNNWPSVAYFDQLPSIDDHRWPPIPEANTPHTASPTIATCVPGLAQDVYNPEKVPQFLVANQKQTLRANELIFVFSGVKDVVDAIEGEETDVDDSLSSNAGDVPLQVTGENWCRDVHKVFATFHPNVKLLCFGERVTAGVARDAMARIATSDVLAFIDTDDQEEADRNQVVQAMFGCHPDMKLLLHSNYGTGRSALRTRYHPYDNLPSTQELRASELESSTSVEYGGASLEQSASISSGNKSQPQCPDRQEGVEVTRGLELRKMVERTHDVLKFGIRTIGGMRPGHLVVRRDVTRYVRSSTIYKGQDTLWARDIILKFAASDETAIFLNRPLTTYFQSSHSFKVNVEKHNSLSSSSANADESNTGGEKIRNLLPTSLQYHDFFFSSSQQTP